MTSLAAQPRHPIAVVVERTGLSQDVLRAWERRYGAVRPARGGGGHRLYSDADVERLRLLHLASRPGRSIAQLATLTTEALSRLAAEDATHAVASSASAPWLDRGLAQVEALDGAQLSAHLRRALASLGLHGFVNEVAAPLMHRIGEGWESGSLTIAQEHLASALLRDILVDAMRSVGHHDGPRMVVATPSGERHEIGAAIAGAVASAAGWDVIYLGADLPADDIIATAERSGATCVCLSVVSTADPAASLEEIRRVRRGLPGDVRVRVGGAGAHAMRDALGTLGIVPETSVTGLS